MYFNSSPNIKQALRPLKYPFSEGDYVIAKNFFKRYTLSEKVFSNVVFFKKNYCFTNKKIDLSSVVRKNRIKYNWLSIYCSP